jgi:acetylornithine deacetylase/succinyl-diaminopimelate desuccinylase-like protein
LQAGDGIHFNQVPTQATAIIDLRIAPSIRVQTVREKIETIVAQYQPSQVKLLACAQDSDHRDQQKRSEYHLIVDILRTYNLKSVALTSNFASDLRYYLMSGIAGIGLTPCTNKSLLHAQDEKISITDLERGRSIFIDIIKSLCR